MIKKLYATACIKDGKNFFTVPENLQDDVRALIEAQGYDILDDGSVVVHVEPEEPIEEN